MRLKKIAFGLLVLVCSFTNAQETKFEFNNEKGMTDFVITPVIGKKAPVIYNNIMDWIRVTYKNPEKVILSKINNEYIRIEGFSEALNRIGVVNKKRSKTNYEIEIFIKDGEYKLDAISFQENWTATAKKAGDTKNETSISKNNSTGFIDSVLYKKDGQFKNYQKNSVEVLRYFNNLNKSLSESIFSSAEKQLVEIENN